MGGFEGGDEGGFWDDDTLDAYDSKPKNKHSETSYTRTSDSGYSIKAHAKVNIFLKITGYQDGRPTLLSRMVRVEDVYDTISFLPCKCESFTIEGCDDIPIESNTIYKAYKALNDFTADSDIEEFFYEHKVVVTQGIPSKAGLGKSSSNAAAFMRLIKEVCNLILSTDELVKIGSSIGSDLPFFIYNYPSANISDYGEIVEPFEEERLNFELHTPKTKCDTTLVDKIFREQLFSDSSLSSFSTWETLDSKSILESISDPLRLNDLYAASLLACPDLKTEMQENWFFSGSTFFKLL